MKVIIAGPSNLYPKWHVIAEAVVQSGFEDIELIIQGGATGVDSAAKGYASEMRLPCVTVGADWGIHGKRAGPIRNRKMAEMADALIAIKRQGMETPGTTSMIREAEKAGLDIYIHEIARNRTHLMSAYDW